MLHERCQETSLGAGGDRELSQMGEGLGCVGKLSRAWRAGKSERFFQERHGIMGVLGMFRKLQVLLSGWS